MSEKELEDFVSTLRALFTEAGLNATRLSSEANLGNDTVGRWMRGEREPNPRTLLEVQKVLDKRLGRNTELTKQFVKVVDAQTPALLQRLDELPEPGTTGSPSVGFGPENRNRLINLLREYSTALERLRFDLFSIIELINRIEFSPENLGRVQYELSRAIRRNREPIDLGREATFGLYSEIGRLKRLDTSKASNEWDRRLFDQDYWPRIRPLIDDELEERAVVALRRSRHDLRHALDDLTFGRGRPNRTKLEELRQALESVIDHADRWNTMVSRIRRDLR